MLNFSATKKGLKILVLLPVKISIVKPVFDQSLLSLNDFVKQHVPTSQVYNHTYFSRVYVNKHLNANYLVTQRKQGNKDI